VNVSIQSRSILTAALLAIGKQAQSNYVYRAQPVPYDWVPGGTPHAEKAVKAPALSEYHVVSQ
jgi:hypothetical protein